MDRAGLREATYSRMCLYARGKLPVCPWCGHGMTRGQNLHLHEVLVKRSGANTSKHWAIMVSENQVLLHEKCHAEHGQTREMRLRCLIYLMRMLGAERVGRWYTGLQHHGISAPVGTPPNSADPILVADIELGARLIQDHRRYASAAEVVYAAHLQGRWARYLLEVSGLTTEDCLKRLG